MEQTNYDRFDLSALLRVESLDPRHSAKSKPSLTVGEYFRLLSSFLHTAPDVSRALVNFEKREADRDDRRSLDQMINILESLGCEKFIVEFHSILDSYEREGNWRLAATHARRMKEDFDEFCGRITEHKEKAGGLAERDEQDQDEGALLLDDAIKGLDEAAAKSKPVILAVDDSPAILQSVWAILNGDYQVLALAKPTDIQKVLQKQTPDLFLLDYMMPEMNGFELIPVIRGFDEHKDTPIIFLTSDGSMDNVTSALALGALDFIVKPFKPEILKEKIAKHIIKKA